MNYSDSRPIAIDLFAGVGGFSLGIEQAGFEVILAVEKDPVHATVHAYNFPHTRVACTDVACLEGDNIFSFLPPDFDARTEIDLLFGGPPCQGFSTIGKRRLEDERNLLIFHFQRLVSSLQPRYFIMENVPGLVSGKFLPVFDRLKAAFIEVGYDCDHRILNASDFGVPQDRRRLFLLGSRTDRDMASFPEPFSGSPPTVRDAIFDLPNLDEFAALYDRDAVFLSEAMLARSQAAASSYARQLRGLSPDPSDFGYPRRWNLQELTSSRRTRHTAESIERFDCLGPGERDPISRFRRLDWERRCYTLRAGTGSERGAHTSPRPIHPIFPRVISVREAARLHSFPDWFRPHATKWHGFREVGNAVPPRLARALGAQIIAALGCDPERRDDLLHLGDPASLNLTTTQVLRYWQERGDGPLLFDEFTTLPAPRSRRATAPPRARRYPRLPV